MVLFCSASEFESLCRDIADKADVVRLQAKGGSMFPFIRSGDWVHVALCKSEKNGIKKGDIILFSIDKNLYLHRVLRITNEGYIVKGDMSLGVDGIINIDDILGSVVSLRRGDNIIDLRTRWSCCIAALAADSSLFLQYPLLFAGKMCSLGGIIFSKIQGLKFYRLIVKKIFSREVILRIAGPQDREQLKDLYLMAGHDIMEGIARIRNEGYWLVAERKGRVVGGLTMTRYEKDAAIWLIFGLEVKPLFRGLGIGRRIVEEAVLKAQGSGANRIGLFVNKKSFPALNLYRKLGFKITDDFSKEYNCSCDELYLSYAIPTAIPGAIPGTHHLFHKSNSIR